METEKPLFNKWLVLAIYATLVILMIVGSFEDYQISSDIFNLTNGFGVFFAAYGEYPATLGLVATGALLLVGRNKESKAWNITQWVLGLLLIGLGTVAASYTPNIYLDISPILIAFIGVICSILTILAVFLLTKKSDRNEVIKVAMVVGISIFSEMIIINVIKIPWGRARMRLVATDSRAYFMPWWQIGTGLKDDLVALGVSAEEFKSFPSGHVGNAIVLMLLGLIPNLNDSFRKQRWVFLTIGGVWTILVIIWRIIMGAHYLTDTVVGAIIVFTSMFLTYKIVYRKHKSKDESSSICKTE